MATEETAAGDTVLPLARTKVFRRPEPLWELVLVAGLVYGLVVAFLGTDSTLSRVGCGAAVVVATAAFGSTTLVSFREAFGRAGEIRIDQESITLDSPEWHPSPVRTPLRGVRLVAVEDGEEKRKFHVQGRSEKASDKSAWLYRDGWNAALPGVKINPLDETPNVAILFDPPVDVTGKKDLVTLALHPRHFVNQRLRVVLARVTDARDATRAFRALGLLRQPTIEDVEAVKPGPEEARRLRRSQAWGFVWLGVIVVGYFGGVLWYVVRG